MTVCIKDTGFPVMSLPGDILVRSRFVDKICGIKILTGGSIIPMILI